MSSNRKTPRYTEESVITSVAPNPRRPGAHSRERYALYEDGMLVGEYVSLAATRWGRPRAKALTDIRWDAGHGHIKLRRNRRSR